MALGSRIKLIIATVIAVLVIIVAFQNSVPVELKLLFWTAPVNRLLLILLTFLLGAAAGMLIAWQALRGKSQ
jgi:uncharacterized integral membrane protein